MFAGLAPGLGTNLLLTAVVSLGVQLLLWAVCMRTRDATLADWWWGLGYLSIALITYVHTWGLGVEARKLLMVILPGIWGLRLSWHLIERSRRDQWRELDRYENYRKEARERGQSVGWVMYRRVFGIQGVMMWITSLPLQVAQFYLEPTTLGTLAYVGVAVWALGFGMEAWTDRQLALFKADPANRSKVLDAGLWRYSRHPNYFGEALVWWGIFLIACEHPIGLLTILSPLRMHHRMAYRKGIVWLEQKMAANKPGYADYMARTNRFYPWWPKKAGAASRAAQSR